MKEDFKSVGTKDDTSFLFSGHLKYYKVKPHGVSNTSKNKEWMLVQYAEIK